MLVSRRKFAEVALPGLLSFALTGCGTVLHPERRGQAAGRLDWGVVALDAVGLCFFFLPGVIAFAVDFNNGTIYLPPEDTQTADSRPNSPRLIDKTLVDEPLTSVAIERVVAAHVGHPVRLAPGAYQTEALASLDQFWETRARYSSP